MRPQYGRKDTHGRGKRNSRIVASLFASRARVRRTLDSAHVPFRLRNEVSRSVDERRVKASMRLRGVPVPQQILRRDLGRRNKPVVPLLHDLDPILIQRNLEHGDQVVVREQGEDGTTDQVR